jgi:hypothetical protein
MGYQSSTTQKWVFVAQNNNLVDGVVIVSRFFASSGRSSSAKLEVEERTVFQSFAAPAVIIDIITYFER